MVTTSKWKLSTSRHKVSSWRELWSGEWSQQPRLRDLSLWAGPHQRPSPQFPQFWLGVKYRAPRLGQKVPPDGKLQRRPVKKGYYIWEPYSARPPRAMKSSRTRSNLSPGIPAAERLGKMHTDEASATSAPSLPVQEELDVWGRTRVDSELSLKTQTDPLVLGWTPSISTPPTQGGASIPRAPVSTGCLLLYCGPPGCKLLAETTTSLEITGGFGMPVCKWTWPQTPLVIYVGDHRCVVWVDEHMVAPDPTPWIC